MQAFIPLDGDEVGTVTVEFGPALSDQELADIERRLVAATPGPWCHRDQFIETASSPELLLGVTMQRNEDGLDGLPGYQNACFIAHAPTDIARLIAEVRRLRTRLDEGDSES